MLVRLLSAFAVVLLTPLTADAADLKPAEVPFLSEDERAMLTRDWRRASDRCKRTYTLAVARGGAWGAYCHRKASAEEVARIAQQKCEHAAQDLCGIVYQRGEARAFAEAAPAMRYPKTFTADQVPFVRDKTRKALAGDYGAAKGAKALALTRNGRIGRITGAADEATAKRRALAACEKEDRNRGRCILYAVGDEVVFTSRTNIFPDIDP